MRNVPKKVLILLAFICVFSCCLMFASACETDKSVTYSVSVTAESESVALTSVKAQWFNGTTAVSEEISLDAEGKASVKLDPGSYTVTLKGVPDGFTFEEGVVTKESPSVVIVIKAIPVIDYSVTVKVPDGVAVPDGLSARLYDGETAVGANVLLNNGSATLSAYEGTYRVEISGLPEYFTYAPATLTPTVSSAQIALNFVEGNFDASVKFEFPKGITIPDDASVQLYDGEEPVGEPAALDRKNSASFTVPNGAYIVKLANIPDYLEFEEKYVSPAAPSADIAVNLAKVEYKLNVISTEVPEVLSSVKITFYTAEGEEVESAKSLSLTENTVTVVLTAGNYEARITAGVNNNVHEWQAAAFTMENREATIEIKKIKYIVHVDIPENANFTYSDITVKLTNDSGEDETAKPDDAGIVVFEVPRGIYGYEITLPASAQDKFVCSVVGEFTEEQHEIIAYVAENRTDGNAYMGDYGIEGEPYTLTATGRYYFQPEPHDFGWYETREVHIHFTAPKDGLYTFSWIDTGVNGDTYCPDYESWSPIFKNSTSIGYIINNNSDIYFMVDYTDGFEDGFIMDVVWSEPPVEGDLLMPFTAVFGENTATKTGEAYFKLPLKPDDESGLEYTVNFEGIEVYYLLGVNATPVKINSGDAVALDDYWGYTDRFLKVVSPDGNIKFTIGKQTKTGSAGKPIELVLDEEISYTFYDTENIWYSFIPEKSGMYRVYPGQNFYGVNIYAAIIEGYGSDQLGNTIYSDSLMDSVVTLEASKTYYFELLSNNGNTVSFSVSEFSAEDAEEGEPWRPIEVSDGETTVGTSEINSMLRFYKYTATKDGVFKFSLNNMGDEDIYVTVHFYKESTYSTDWVVDESYYGNSGAEGYWQIKNGDVLMSKGTVIWFSVNYNIYSESLSTINFKIEMTEVTSVAKDGENTLGNADSTIRVEDYKYIAAKDGVLNIGHTVGDDLTFVVLIYRADGTLVDGSSVQLKKDEVVYISVVYSYSGETPLAVSFTLSM